MSTVVYIQGDLIKNPYLNKEISGMTLLEHTIEGLLPLVEANKIFISVHKNKTNSQIEYIKSKYPKINLYYSKEQNAGKRMIEALKHVRPKTIIRVTADQLFLDTEHTTNMVSHFINSDTDILYHNLNDGLLPEILTYDALDKCQLQIGKYHRFLKYVHENPHALRISKYHHPCETPFFRFYIRNDREYYMAKLIFEEGLDYYKLNLYGDLLFGDTGLYEEGWFNSFKRKQSINNLNQPVPWMTYPAIDFLKSRVDKSMDVFEYGCGAGTLWWTPRVNTITACEHNLAWIKHINKELPANAKVIYTDLSKGVNYATQVEKTGSKYHIIVIDSRDRINCAKSAVKALLPCGVIIWDDSQRAADDEGKEYILSKGFRKIEFSGMGPIVKDKNETTIFYRDGNCLGI